MPVWRAKPVAPAPVAKVGDRVQVGGKWFHVESTAGYTGKVWACQLGRMVPAWVSIDEITDVYTAEEFARNGALVQIHEGTQWPDEAPGTGMDDDLGWKQGFNFLTPEATAALREFTKIDRPIRTGDCVRDQYGDVFVVDAESRMYAYDAADEVHERPISYGDLTHVAKEDREYVKPAPMVRPSTDLDELIKAADADYDRKMDADFNSLDEESFTADLNTDVDWPTDARARADQIAREFQRLANDVREWCPGYKRMGITKDEKRCYCDVSGWIEERASELLAAVQAEQAGGEG